MVGFLIYFLTSYSKARLLKSIHMSLDEVISEVLIDSNLKT